MLGFTILMRVLNSLILCVKSLFRGLGNSRKKGISCLRPYRAGLGYAPESRPYRETVSFGKAPTQPAAWAYRGPIVGHALRYGLQRFRIAGRRALMQNWLHV